jgi:predicted transcriptional regulator
MCYNAGMNYIERKSAGVKFESDMMEFVDRLAREQQRSRSFVINAILRWYARWVSEQHKVEMSQRKEPVIRA